MQAWLVPYVKSRLLPGDFNPIVAYLFTEWKCNVECHYCWAFDNRINGMSEATARRAIDWLHGDTPCRVLALMGGEVLLRAKFAHKVVDYARRKGFFTYVPTNGRLLNRDNIDRLADAGVATFNVAVDAVDVKPGLPKALTEIPAFEYLLKKQYRYGYTVFLNINICRNNLDDVRALTEIAHANLISTDYHINETPLIEQPHFRFMHDNPTFITPQDWTRVDDLIDWLIARQRDGYTMANSVQRLAEMKEMMRGGLNRPWNCRAGRNTLIIRIDGSLAPCFPMYSAATDWGTVGRPRFDPAQLDSMQAACEGRCFSTLNHIVGYCYNDARVLRWLLKQTRHGFQGVNGNFS